MKLKIQMEIDIEEAIQVDRPAAIVSDVLLYLGNLMLKAGYPNIGDFTFTGEDDGFVIPVEGLRVTGQAKEVRRVSCK